MILDLEISKMSKSHPKCLRTLVRLLRNVRTQIYDGRMKRMRKLSWVVWVLWFFFCLIIWWLGWSSIPWWCLTLLGVMLVFLYASMFFVGTLRASPAAILACPGPRSREPPGPSALVPAVLLQGVLLMPTARSCPWGTPRAPPVVSAPRTSPDNLLLCFSDKYQYRSM